MTLERLPDGSHVFKAPVAAYVPLTDPQGRTQTLADIPVPPLQPPKFSRPQPVREHGMRGYDLATFQVTFNDLRGTWKQEGSLDEVANDFAYTDLVCDAPGVMRHPLYYELQAAADTDVVNSAETVNFIGRMVHETFQGVLYVMFAVQTSPSQIAPVLFQELPDGTMQKVAGFTPTPGLAVPMCMATVHVNGTWYLAIGYNEPTGGTFGVEMYATPTSAPAQVDTSNGHVGGGTQVCGITQGPDGTIYILTADGTIRSALNNVAPAALSFADVQTKVVAPWGYFIGQVALANYLPGILIWSSIEGQSLLQGATGQGDFEPRGRILLMSYDGTYLEPIDFPDLEYVVWATVYKGGVVACNGRRHFWYTGNRMRALDSRLRRPLDSHKKTRCRGHGVALEKFLITRTEMDDRWRGLLGDIGYQTRGFIEEYDPYVDRLHPVTVKRFLQWGGDASNVTPVYGTPGGGYVAALPEMPYSLNTGYMHHFTIFEVAAPGPLYRYGLWLRQYQPRENGIGYDERGTDPANPSHGHLFDPQLDGWISAAFHHPQLEGWELTPAAIIPPRVESILTGGPKAKIRFDCGGYSVFASADEPEMKFNRYEFGNWPDRTWATALQLIVRPFQDEVSGSGSDYLHWTSNCLPFTLEVVARRAQPRGVSFG